jgi:hypothetical protein
MEDMEFDRPARFTVRTMVRMPYVGANLRTRQTVVTRLGARSAGVNGGEPAGGAQQGKWRGRLVADAR